MPRHLITTDSFYPPAYITGNYYDCGIDGTTRTTIAGVATRLVVMPFVPVVSFSIDRIAIDCTTAVASAQARAVIYDSDTTNNLPNTRLYDTAEFDCSAPGVKEETIGTPFAFKAGHLYWIGVHSSSTATFRGVAIASCPAIGVIGTASGAVYTGYRRDVAFGTDSPDPFGTPTLADQIIPQVKFRAA